MTLALDRYARAAALHQHRFGEHRLTYLPDGVAYLDPRAWFPAATDEIWDAHAHLINPDGWLVASVGALLVEYRDHTLLIDAGFGPMALPTPFGLIRGGELLRSLDAAGKHPDDIDAIALTHLHLDHIGWLWQPSSPFTNTPVLVGDTEWHHRHLATTDGITPEILDTFADRVRTITDHQQVAPGIHATTTPGHSLGHLTYTLTATRHRVIAFGDALQTPLQVRHPELTAALDDDPDASRTTARRLVDDLSTPGTLGFGIHFADTQLGHVTTTPTGTRTWQPT
ncbi:MBL fold metallo-hydrolase [Nocardia cyriacigeorgica]|uniref:MBL fold metallo-hydrolase n=1 Tax=Nocardia cyriacigeorgica TaxID=135487 RepID=A0A5R8NAD1_9NOCA|nr:MBL fold metallo-hydrolase [Nocardia cyriacigeorgica]MBF6427876.1 MBL fold metallo-hydrolase [Nocardia cyriacigeorgica]TLF72453.1 MBL fold metallo-hydrolase [Nocardia cyriacigeorgica]